MRLRQGDFLDEFRILDIIGSGGFSVVYKAEDTLLERPVAIKQLDSDAFKEYGTQERFIREAKLAANLNHPHIVSIYTFKRQGDSLFLIMEYLDGGSVRDLIDTNGRLPSQTLLKLAAHVCPALDILHTKGIIHRDIKPENILRTAEGDFKLVDFGLAHVAHSDRRSSAGPQSGTLLYMSPEQAAGRDVNALSDIYSFATVLYEAWTGSYYLPGSGSEESLIRRIQEDDPLPPSVLNSRVPPALDETLLLALSKVPEDRYQDGTDLLLALMDAANGLQQLDELIADLYAVRALRELEGDAEQALEKLESPPLVYAEEPEVMAERAETLLALDQPLEGISLLQRAVEIKRELPYAQLALAGHYRRMGAYEQYRVAIIAAIESDPDLVYAMLAPYLIESLEQPYDIWEIVELFGTSEQTAPVVHNFGRLLMLVEEYQDEGIAAFKMAIQIDPVYGPPQVALGSALLTQGETRQALNYFLRATSLGFPDYPPGEWHRSTSAYQRSHAYAGLALAYAALGDILRSAHAAADTYDWNPAHIEEHADTLLLQYSETAQTLLQQGRYQEVYDLLNRLQALAEWREYTTVMLQIGIAQVKIGSALRQQQAYRDAVAWLEASVELLEKVPAQAGDVSHSELLMQLSEARRELSRARQQR